MVRPKQYQATVTADAGKELQSVWGSGADRSRRVVTWWRGCEEQKPTTSDDLADVGRAGNVGKTITGKSGSKVSLCATMADQNTL